MAPDAGERSEDPFAHTRMTLGEHLGELRKRLFRGVLAVVLLFIGGLFFSDQITAVILQPHRDSVAKLNAEQEALAREQVEQHPEER